MIAATLGILGGLAAMVGGLMIPMLIVAATLGDANPLSEAEMNALMGRPRVAQRH